ncbi:hypothetical protein [Actinoplanes regularis]|uniref:Uncharacterized protein n=1 Tax=Actinoplanes regularis TaxID=52697 RepID=A0A239AXR4_9ACTN|nr:hypothetical protein [Actinoplanes regularis]SNS00526.1 hypothetical protein SAMN06264365_108201 [Actinoplanes regularis]
MNQTEESVHLTFVVRERSGFWIGQKLTGAAIESEELRRVIAPADVTNEKALAATVTQARDQLVAWLEKVDGSTMATELLSIATSELEPDYL